MVIFGEERTTFRSQQRPNISQVVSNGCIPKSFPRKVRLRKCRQVLSFLSFWAIVELEGFPGPQAPRSHEWTVQRPGEAEPSKTANSRKLRNENRPPPLTPHSLTLELSYGHLGSWGGAGVRGAGRGGGVETPVPLAQISWCKRSKPHKEIATW